MLKTWRRDIPILADFLLLLMPGRTAVVGSKSKKLVGRKEKKTYFTVILTLKWIPSQVYTYSSWDIIHVISRINLFNLTTLTINSDFCIVSFNFRGGGFSEASYGFLLSLAALGRTGNAHLRGPDRLRGDLKSKNKMGLKQPQKNIHRNVITLIALPTLQLWAEVQPM